MQIDRTDMLEVLSNHQVENEETEHHSHHNVSINTEQTSQEREAHDQGESNRTLDQRRMSINEEFETAPLLDTGTLPRHLNRRNQNIAGSPQGRTNPAARSALSMAHMYVIFSIFFASLAIISPAGRIQHHHKDQQQVKGSAVLHGDIHASVRKLLEQAEVDQGHAEQSTLSAVEQIAKAAATVVFSDANVQKSRGKNAFLKYTENGEDSGTNVASAVVSDDGQSSTFLFGILQRDPPQNSRINGREQTLPPWLRWMEIFQKNRKNIYEESNEDDKVPLSSSLASKIARKFIDPVILDLVSSLTSPSNCGEWKEKLSDVATEIVDKVLTSTPRIFTIINLLLAVTYLTHSIVANFFLGEVSMLTTDNTEHEFGVEDATLMSMGVGASASDRMHRSGRERLGGYLLFKLLLITAVVEPDTLDLLILLTWYTVLAFLRSLSYLAGITTAHTAASGQSPHRGVLRLLITVLICNISAATTCAALFHDAGMGMLLLLTCDCVLLALDVFTHFARYTQQILDEKHQTYLNELEMRQIEMHEDHRNIRESDDAESDIDEEVRLQSRRLDHEMELKDALHARLLSILDYTAFMLELFALLVTILHFIHVWVLHGVTFNLVDGVLALHLHSAVSAFGKKVAERRNHNRIARDLNSYFCDATDMELSKASAAGDMCCICLGTMTMGNVKKVGCGHLYHTHCLREVVERAHSFEAARCPLCRGSIVDGSQVPRNSNTIGTPQTAGTGHAGFNAHATAGMNEEGGNIGGDNRGNIIQQNERALFRISTEGIVPTWLPIPAFSFEVVRRFPSGAEADMFPPAPVGGQPTALVNPVPPVANRIEYQDEEPSMWRRWRSFLMLAGAIPMSQEEEAVAIAQLVDMFPQYARGDLLRELRSRGSAEAVVESILADSFIGMRRNGAVSDVDSPPQDSQLGDDGSQEIAEETNLETQEVAI